MGLLANVVLTQNNLRCGRIKTSTDTAITVFARKVPVIEDSATRLLHSRKKQLSVWIRLQAHPQHQLAAVVEGEEAAHQEALRLLLAVGEQPSLIHHHILGSSIHAGFFGFPFLWVHPCGFPPPPGKHLGA